MFRSLVHYWRVNLAVVLGAAVATAVLTGALLVGDSVRGSLRELTLDRLGRIDDALVTDRFFRESLADGFVSTRGARLTDVAPAILLRGAAVHADSGSRASKVAIHGIDDRFSSLFGRAGDLNLSPREGRIFPSVVINQSLRRELDAEVGDPLLLTFGRWSQVPRDTLMGEKDPDDLLATLRLTVSRILPDRGMGRFGLSPHQQNPLNAFVALDQLQRALQQPGKVNSILRARGSTPVDQVDHEVVLDSSSQSAQLSSTTLVPENAVAILKESLQLEDLGLVVKRGEDHLAVESREFVIRPDIDETIEAVVAELGSRMLRVQTYLANAMRARGRLLPYSTITAVDPLQGSNGFSLKLTDGSAAPRPSADGILLNTWAAKDLGVEVGDTIQVGYYMVGPREELRTEQTHLRLEGIVALEALAADRGLTPDYPGIQEAGDISDWDPPFPVDLSLIRPKDEEYWDSYGATPKAFVAEETGRRLWSSRFGSTTSVRIGAAPGESLQETERRLRKGLLEKLPPESFGFTFQPVKEEGLRAATGATDFSGLFLAFSFFLIVSSALLIGLLFSLGVEQRAKEIGLLLAVGYRLRSIRLRLLVEGVLLAAAGALLGTAGGIGYAGLLLAGLRTLWLPAVGSSQLFLHVKPLGLALGWLIAVVVVLLSIAGTVLRLGKVPSPALLAGSLREPAKLRRGRLAIVLAYGGTVGALGLLAAAIFTGAFSSPGLAFGTGVLLLIAGLAFFSIWCRGSRARGLGRGSVALYGMAARNSSWSPGRSMLCVALVGSACFVIVTVAANRQELGDELEARDSGAGGFALVAEADIPLHQHPGREPDRFDLGFSEAASRELEQVEFFPFRLLPGDDASCLNLYRPEKPRVLGVPPELVRRGGFRFQQRLKLPEAQENPWGLLAASLEPDVIPAVADYNSARWILHLGLGQELVLENEFGQPIRLRLVGLLDRSVFQSELLISEENFLKHFPSRTGYAYFLIEAPFEKNREIAQLLEGNLSRFGFDGATTREKLASFQAVEHTYLSTFQMLGGLGLLLGTLGLGIVLVRNVIERRGELATLRAFGFRRSSLVGLVLAENAFLLLSGMLIGSLAALIAAAPRLAVIHVPWLSLLTTLAVVLLVGMLSSTWAVLGALRVPLLPALKAER